MKPILHTGHAYNWDQSRMNVIAAGIQASELTFARVQGMKIRAELDRPQAAVGGFPYPARNCAEWTTA